MRYQVKFRRRREGKTHYRHRLNLIRQDLNKYGNAKSRFVVRITNTKVICQIFKAYVEGDRLVASADSTELKKYGIEFGLTNYSASYATGLLCARRALKLLKLEDSYGKGNIDGEYEVVENKEDGPRAYVCYLDIGLARSTKGARVFAAMKGASDGGVSIPHRPSKFYGYDEENPEDFDAESLRDRIFGKNISEYMISLRESHPEKYKKQFSGYIKKGIDPSAIEGIYQAAFSKINENPDKSKKSTGFDYSEFKRFIKPKISLEERKTKIGDKLASIKAEN